MMNLKAHCKRTVSFHERNFVVVKNTLILLIVPINVITLSISFDYITPLFTPFLCVGVCVPITSISVTSVFCIDFLMAIISTSWRFILNMDITSVWKSFGHSYSLSPWFGLTELAMNYESIQVTGAYAGGGGGGVGVNPPPPPWVIFMCIFCICVLWRKKNLLIFWFFWFFFNKKKKKKKIKPMADLKKVTLPPPPSPTEQMSNFQILRPKKKKKSVRLPIYWQCTDK